MFFTCHIVAGIAISKTGLNPEIVLPLSFVSHFVLDALPHTDEGAFITKKNEEGIEHFTPKNPREWGYMVFDVVLGLILLTIVFLKLPSFYLVLGAFLATLPDVIDNTPFWYKLKKYPVFRQFNSVHEFFHFNIPKSRWYFGIISEIIILGVGLWFLL